LQPVAASRLAASWLRRHAAFTSAIAAGRHGQRGYHFVSGLDPMATTASGTGIGVMQSASRRGAGYAAEGCRAAANGKVAARWHHRLGAWSVDRLLPHVRGGGAGHARAGRDASRGIAILRGPVDRPQRHLASIRRCFTTARGRTHSAAPLPGRGMARAACRRDRDSVDGLQARERAIGCR
jgi:hypothetical protein